MEDREQGSSSLSDDETRLAGIFIAGRLTELIDKLNSVLPSHEYEYIRQLCRTAAQVLQELRDVMNPGD